MVEPTHALKICACRQIGSCNPKYIEVKMPKLFESNTFFGKSVLPTRHHLALAQFLKILLITLPVERLGNPTTPSFNLDQKNKLHFGWKHFIRPIFFSGFSHKKKSLENGRHLFPGFWSFFPKWWMQPSPIPTNLPPSAALMESKVGIRIYARLVRAWQRWDNWVYT